MKRLALIFCVSSCLWADPVRIPEEFTVVERFFSPISTFDASTDLAPVGVVRKRLLSWTPTFDLEDAQELPLATASTHFFAWGTVADVLDPNGEKIGWIEENVLRIIPWAEYRIFNKENQITAIAKMNLWGTHFELYHPDRAEEVYATISRPFIRLFRDHWTVQILNTSIFEENIIDPRLLILLAVFQTDKDARDRIRAELQDAIRRELDDFEAYRW